MEATGNESPQSTATAGSGNADQGAAQAQPPVESQSVEQPVTTEPTATDSATPGTPPVTLISAANASPVSDSAIVKDATEPPAAEAGQVTDVTRDAQSAATSVVPPASEPKIEVQPSPNEQPAAAPQPVIESPTTGNATDAAPSPSATPQPDANQNHPGPSAGNPAESRQPATATANASPRLATGHNNPASRASAGPASPPPTELRPSHRPVLDWQGPAQDPIRITRLVASSDTHKETFQLSDGRTAFKRDGKKYYLITKDPQLLDQIVDRAVEEVQKKGTQHIKINSQNREIGSAVFEAALRRGITNIYNYTPTLDQRARLAQARLAAQEARQAAEQAREQTLQAAEQAREATKKAAARDSIQPAGPLTRAHAWLKDPQVDMTSVPREAIASQPAAAFQSEDNIENSIQPAGRVRGWLGSLFGLFKRRGSSARMIVATADQEAESEEDSENSIQPAGFLSSLRSQRSGRGQPQRTVSANTASVRAAAPPRRNGYTLLDEIKGDYAQHGNTGTFLDRDGNVAFEIQRNKVVVKSNKQQDIVAGTITAIDQYAGKRLHVKGTEQFRREAWVTATSLGIEVTGYKANERDWAAVGKRIKQHESPRGERSAQQDAPAPAAPTPAPTPAAQRDAATDRPSHMEAEEADAAEIREPDPVPQQTPGNPSLAPDPAATNPAAAAASTRTPENQSRQYKSNRRKLEADIKLKVFGVVRTAMNDALEAAAKEGKVLNEEEKKTLKENAALAKLRTLTNWDTRDPVNPERPNNKAPSPSQVFGWAKQIDEQEERDGREPRAKLTEEFDFLSAKVSGRTRFRRSHQTNVEQTPANAAASPPGSQTITPQITPQIHVTKPEQLDSVSGRSSEALANQTEELRNASQANLRIMQAASGSPGQGQRQPHAAANNAGPAGYGLGS